MTASVFDLSASSRSKAVPGLVAVDDEYFARVAESVNASIADLQSRITATLAQQVRIGREAMDRDEEVERVSRRLRVLQRYSLDLCLGRMTTTAGEHLYVGRLGLSDSDGGRLLIDWRSPAAAPFFAATLADPHGLVSRRRYRWTDGRVTDYWDEVFTTEPVEGVAPDDDSVFIASLGADRSSRMRDVLATIATDQDAIIRAGSRGALVVDGGPGTGKTVVALHRSAYLLYADPMLGEGRGGVLFVGPSRPYLDYVSDVLPSLGEDNVQTCILRDLVPEGATAVAEPDVDVRRLKASGAWVDVIEEAVRFYEEPPTSTTVVVTPWDEVRLTPHDWQAAFSEAEGMPHNEARDAVWDRLLDMLVDKHSDQEATPAQLRRALTHVPDLRALFDATWPLIEYTDLVADLWRIPAYLRRCAPWLSKEQMAQLRRADSYAWTVADLPLLDAARRRLGDPTLSVRRRRAEAEAIREHERMDLVVDELLHHDEEGLLAQLRQDGIRDALDGTSATLPLHDPLSGPFAHVVVDEAQELTDSEWQMILSRSPSRSVTIVGDRAQARHGFPQTWTERLRHVGFGHISVMSLNVNYRTPSEVMTEAELVIRAAMPDANVPTSIRSSGIPVEHGDVSSVAAVVDTWLTAHGQGVACVIGAPWYPSSARVASLPPELVKGLEFDLVVLVDPDTWGTGIQVAVDQYVAMTRTTRRLVILDSHRLP